VAELKEILSQRGLGVRIEVDGGVDAGNAATLVRAGADVLVAGNAVFGQGDPTQNARDILRRMREGER
jgi:ribulose-phosphate 3-epimerase